MATRTASTNIKLSGEKEYKEAISNINAGLGVLNSEMKKTSEEFKNNEKSTEALTKKGDILQRTLLSQKEKVEELQKALDNAKKEYGEADERTMKWEKSLNEAEAAVLKTEHAIDENNKALDESKERFANFEKVGTAAAAAVAAGFAALVATYKELIDLTREVAASADNTLTLAQITGLDTESIQELQYASEFVDVSFETIQSSLTKLKNNMDDAASGTGKMAEVFEDLGVSVTDSVDGSLRNAEEVFYDVVDALGEINNETERDAKSMDVFGKKAEALNPIIKNGSKSLKEYAEEAKNVGYVLSDEQLKALGAVDDAYQKLKKTQEGVKQQIATDMAPAVEKFYKSWTDWMQKAGNALQDSGVVNGLDAILEAIIDLLPNSEQMEALIPKITSALQGLADILSKVKIYIDDIKNTLNVLSKMTPRGLFSGDLFDAIGKFSSDHQSNVNNYKAATGGWVYNEATGLYEGNYYANAPGDMNFIGGATMVGENGPEMVMLPQGSQILNNQDTRSMGGDVFNITIPANTIKEFNDIIEIAHGARVTARMRG